MTRTKGMKSIDIYEEDWKNLKEFQSECLKQEGDRNSMADLVHLIFETYIE